jgi:hypothetical protein
MQALVLASKRALPMLQLEIFNQLLLLVPVSCLTGHVTGIP